MERYDQPDRIYSYRYACVNDSLIDKLYKYWWPIAFRAVPPRMSANRLSMLGNLGSWAALIALVAFGASVGPDRPWIFALCGLSVFIYHTMDCLDGMQARRIGASGPLGEFIDHWFDAINVFFFPLGAIAAFPVIPVPWAAAAVIVSGLADWVVLRETTKTGRLYFGPISSEEGITVYMLFLLSVPFVGYDFWATPIGPLGVPPVMILIYMLILGYGVATIINLIRLRFDGFASLAVQVASTAPLALWLVVAESSGRPRALVMFGLATAGFVGTRHVGDMLRVRLVGLRQPRWYPDLAIGAAACLAVSIAVLAGAAAPTWLFALPMVIVAACTASALIMQFSRTLSRVKSCLGIGLFDIPATQPQTER